MSRNIWKDDEELPEKVTIRIVVEDFYLRNKFRLLKALVSGLLKPFSIIRNFFHRN